MKPDLATPPVYSPCSKKWELMHQTGLRSQFCDRCRLPVHNLSAMSEREAEGFLERSKTRRTCITYEMRRDGTMITRSWREVLRWQRFRLRNRLFSAVRTGLVIRHLRGPIECRNMAE